MAAVGIHFASKLTKIKKRRNKTLAKPMLYNRLLNCRDSGLLEQKNAPELPIGRFLESKSLGGNRVILAVRLSLQ